MKSLKLWQKIVLIISFIALLVFCALDIFKVQILASEVASKMLSGALLRLSGAVCVLMFLPIFKYNKLAFAKVSLKNLLIIIPAFIIALNNFPFIDFFAGKLQFTNPNLLFLFALECLAVGLFEELIFRAIIFIFILERKCNTKKQIFFSICVASAIFGAVHLVNLFAGAGFGSVALQIGYSFLIGALMCFVLLVTNNVLICAFLHALYNFCGLLYPTLGSGNVWSVPTIVITAVVAVLVVAYCSLIFVSKKHVLPQKIKALYIV